RAEPVRRPPRRLSACAGRLGDLGWFEEHHADRVRAFRANQPALDLFPTALWAQVAARRLRRAPPGLLLGCEPMGHLLLREEVARYLVTSRGARCAPEQVAIVSGVQEALDVVARLLLDPGDRVAMESPGYLGATRVFEAAGAAISPVRVDAEGLDPADPALRGVRLVYLTPAHQFPLGAALGLSRRLALLEWAAASGALVLEDDYDSEYRYSGKPLPALQGLDQHGQVLLAGSFGKVLFPSLRLGYLVVPPDLVDPVRSLLSITRRHAPLLDQAVLADFLAGGHFGRHLRRMREVYSERLGVLTECVGMRLAGLLDLPPVEAGLQTVGLLRGGIRGRAAAEVAAARGLEVTDIGRYSHGRAAPEGLVLGFAAVPPAEIRRGVRELGAALEGLTRAR
ncbi:MAG TPA: PLP-dependent aminotransferase family protein, partial [Gemmatimonadales bacterium]|nr:PLP-dependent aminotransferase family protein [Gemmatimonadales bacterium]